MKTGWRGVHHLAVMHQVEHVLYRYFPEMRLWVGRGILYWGKSWE